MSDKEVKITYEALFELLRREKNRDELQVLQDTFFSDVKMYISEKEFSLEEFRQNNSLLASKQRQKAEHELNNIRRIVTELYERREKKIINMAINMSRTASNIIDKSPLLESENSFFESQVILLDQFRKNILIDLFTALREDSKKKEQDKAKELLEKETLDENEQKQPSAEEILKDADESTDSIDSEKDSEKIIDESSADSLVESSAESLIKRVKFKTNLPKFKGPDEKIYGPFEKDYETELPDMIANILNQKGRVELV